jgi:Zn-dependent protease
MPEPVKKNNSSRWITTGIGLFLLTKLKAILALLKLSKFGGTLISMIISIAAYAWAFKLPFAIGFVLLLFVHEMGHVIAARIKKLPVSTPMFIPFLGALITLKKNPRDAVTEAYVAFGGPLLGTLGAIAVFAAGVWMDSGLLISIAYTGFLLNLFNLFPIHPLDGGRISAAVTRWLWLVGLIGGLAYIIYDFSILLAIIWALFAWELYSKYVGKRKKKGMPEAVSLVCSVDLTALEQAGAFIPGEAHRRELPFEVFPAQDGEQMVRFRWEGLDMQAEVQVPEEAVVSQVWVTGVRRDEASGQLHIRCEVRYEDKALKRYYEVPVKTRWMYGTAYFLLAAFLCAMMLISHSMLSNYVL